MCRYAAVVKLWQAAGEGLDVVVASGVAKGVKHLLGRVVTPGCQIGYM